jgi:hypothetical protein
VLCAEEEEDRVGDLDDAWDPHVQVFCGTHLQVKTKQKRDGVSRDDYKLKKAFC